LITSFGLWLVFTGKLSNLKSSKAMLHGVIKNIDMTGISAGMVAAKFVVLFRQFMVIIAPYASYN
jgi:hypothetical protein